MVLIDVSLGLKMLQILNQWEQGHTYASREIVTRYNAPSLRYNPRLIRANRIDKSESLHDYSVEV